MSSLCFWLSLWLFCFLICCGRKISKENINCISFGWQLSFFISSIIQLSLIIAGASAVIVFQDYVKYGQRIDELENATMQSELEQLKNQINPHFLFNMLNNANVLIRENPVEAVHVLSKLKDLLKYQLKDSTSETVYLADDIRFL